MFSYVVTTDGPLVPLSKNNFEVLYTNSSYLSCLFKQTLYNFLKSIWLTSVFWLGDGIVVKGQAYGIWSIRVDGNDALAVYSAVHTAREIAIKEQRPVLISFWRKNDFDFSCNCWKVCILYVYDLWDIYLSYSYLIFLGFMRFLSWIL